MNEEAYPTTPYSEEDEPRNQQLLRRFEQLYFPERFEDGYTVVSPREVDDEDWDDVLPDRLFDKEDIIEEDNDDLLLDDSYVDKDIRELIDKDIENEIIFTRMFDTKRSGIIIRSKSNSNIAGPIIDDIISPDSLSNIYTDNDEDNMLFLDLVQSTREEELNNLKRCRKVRGRESNISKKKAK